MLAIYLRASIVQGKTHAELLSLDRIQDGTKIKYKSVFMQIGKAALRSKWDPHMPRH